MSEGTKVGSGNDFLTCLQSLSDGSTGVSIQQIEPIIGDIPEDITVSQLNQMVIIASNQCGIWEAEYMFSPANFPNTEAKVESDCWHKICEMWLKMLEEYTPNMREQIERRHRLIVASYTVKRSIDCNRNRPLRRFAVNGVSRIAIGLNKLGLEKIGEHLYRIALYPKGTTGRILR